MVHEGRDINKTRERLVHTPMRPGDEFVCPCAPEKVSNCDREASFELGGEVLEDA